VSTIAAMYRPAVVHQENVPAARPLVSRFSTIAGSRATVSNPRRVQRRSAVHACHHRIEHRIPDAHRCAEKKRRTPGNVTEHRLRRTDVPPQRHWSVKSEETEWRMLWFSMVWPRLTISLTMSGCAAALSPMQRNSPWRRSVEDIQHHRRNFRVRAVVERDGNFSAARRRIGQSQHVVAEQAVLGHIPISPNAT